MPLKSRAYAAMPVLVEKLCRTLGERLKVARKRRRISQQELADRAAVSRQTIQRLESGDPAVGLGIFMTAVWLLRLDHEFQDALSPQRDLTGLREDFRHLPERIDKKRTKPREVGPHRSCSCSGPNPTGSSTGRSWERRRCRWATTGRSAG